MESFLPETMFDPTEDGQTIVGPKDAAESAGLRYVSDVRPGIRRKKYLRAAGRSKLSGASETTGIDLIDKVFVREIRAKPGMHIGSAICKKVIMRRPACCKRIRKTRKSVIRLAEVARQGRFGDACPPRLISTTRRLP
jgi:hypothetical protein